MEVYIEVGVCIIIYVAIGFLATWVFKGEG